MPFKRTQLSTTGMNTKAYQPIQRDSINTELKTLEQISNVIKGRWEEECTLYERIGTRITDAFDSRLFPYHEVLKPLLDIYDESNMSHRGRTNEVEVDFDGYWPNSASSIYSCLLPKNRAPVFRHKFGSAMIDAQTQHYWSNFSFLDEWEANLRKYNQSRFEFL